MFDIILIQLFWASFFVVGLVVLILAHQLYAQKLQSSSFWRFLRAAPVGTQGIIAFATGCTIFVIPVAAAYIFELPIAWLELLYLCVLGVSLGVVFWRRKAIWQHVRRARSMQKSQILVMAIVVIVLGLDYLISLRVGGSIAGDAPLHVGKLQLFLNNGHLSLADAHLGYNGVLDLRYSTNLLNAFQIIIAQLLGLSATTVWFYSYAFYRLLVWLCVFALAKAFLPAKSPKEWPIIIMMLCPFIYTGYFFTNAELPHAVILIWASIFLIGLKLLFEKSSWYLVLLGAILIGVTHTVAAFIAIVFLCMLAVALLVGRRITKQQLKVLCIATAILCIPAFSNIALPAKSVELGIVNKAGGLHSVNLDAYYKGPFVLGVPDIDFFGGQTAMLDWAFFAMILLLVPYVLLLRKVKNPRGKKAIFVVIVLAALATFNVLYASLVGALYLVWSARSRAVKILIALATIFYAIIVYNPIVLTLTRRHIPLIFLVRFQDFNTLAYITPLIGVLVAYAALVRFAHIKGRWASSYTLAIVIIIAALLPAHRFPLSTERLTTFDQQLYMHNQHDYARVKELQKLDVFLHDQIVFTNDYTIATQMNMATKSRQLAFVVGEQSSSPQNLSQRTKCQRQLFQFLRASDLKAANVTHLALVPGVNSGSGTWQDDFQLTKSEQPYNFAQKLPYLELEQQLGDIRIYRVKPITDLTTDSVCKIPYGG